MLDYYYYCSSSGGGGGGGEYTSRTIAASVCDELGGKSAQWGGTGSFDCKQRAKLEGRGIPVPSGADGIPAVLPTYRQ
jgi:hypothetical protein